MYKTDERGKTNKKQDQEVCFIENNQIEMSLRMSNFSLLKIFTFKTYVHLSVFYCLLLNIPLDLLEFALRQGS